MRSKIFIIVFCSTCAFLSKTQVWKNFINAVPNIGPPDIYCAAEDTNINVLYLGGGRFSKSFGQFTTNCIVKFDGFNFDILKSGIDDDSPGNFSSQVRNLIFYKSKLYVFGFFEKAGHY